MATNLTVAINHSSSDEEYGASGVDWIDVNLANDKLIFSAGSATVADEQAIPSESDLNSAATVITTSKVIVSKYFLEDISESKLKEIFLAGDTLNSGRNRYVFAFDFDGATASEPVLEVWDDTDMDSTDDYSLGNGTPSSSWFYGITTTDAAPGAGWAGDTPTEGKRLAGSTTDHFLWLNNENGALSGADTLYCQLKIIVPANAPYSGSETPIIVCKYTSN